MSDVPTTPTTAPASKAPRAPLAPKVARKAVPGIPGWLLAVFIVAAIGLVGGIAYVSTTMASKSADALRSQPQLGAEFAERHNQYAIRPPRGWRIEDPHDQTNIYLMGPKEALFPPLMVVNLSIRAGNLDAYIQEHKARISFENKTTTFISDEPDALDGAPSTRRLVYEYDHATDSGETVRLRTLQYIVEDRPRFYRITSHARVDTFEFWAQSFELSSRSFRRLPLPKPDPRRLSE